MNAYRKGDYPNALTFALKFNMPGYCTAHVFTAAVYGQLGMREQAQKALQQVFALRPGFAAEARQQFANHDPDLRDHLIDGLHKAGLEIPYNQSVAPTTTSSSPPSIAVLPWPK